MPDYTHKIKKQNDTESNKRGTVKIFSGDSTLNVHSSNVQNEYSDNQVKKAQKTQFETNKTEKAVSTTFETTANNSFANNFSSHYVIQDAGNSIHKIQDNDTTKNNVEISKKKEIKDTEAAEDDTPILTGNGTNPLRNINNTQNDFTTEDVLGKIEFNDEDNDINKSSQNKNVNISNKANVTSKSELTNKSQIIGTTSDINKSIEITAQETSIGKALDIISESQGAGDSYITDNKNSTVHYTIDTFNGILENRIQAENYMFASKKNTYTSEQAKKISDKFVGMSEADMTEGKMLKKLLGPGYMTNYAPNNKSLKDIAANNTLKLNAWLERNSIPGSTMTIDEIQLALKKGRLIGGKNRVLTEEQKFILREKLQIMRAEQSIRKASLTSNLISSVGKGALRQTIESSDAGQTAIKIYDTINGLTKLQQALDEKKKQKATKEEAPKKNKKPQDKVDGTKHSHYTNSSDKEKWSTRYKASHASVENGTASGNVVGKNGKMISASEGKKKLFSEKFKDSLKKDKNNLREVAKRQRKAREMARAARKAKKALKAKQAAKTLLATAGKGGMAVAGVGLLSILLVIMPLFPVFMTMLLPGAGFPDSVGADGQQMVESTNQTYGGIIGFVKHMFSHETNEGDVDPANPPELVTSSSNAIPQYNIYNPAIKAFDHYITNMEQTFMNEWNSRHNGKRERHGGTGPRAINVKLEFWAAGYDSGTGLNAEYKQVSRDDFLKALLVTASSATGNTVGDIDFFRGYINDIGMGVIEHPELKYYYSSFREPNKFAEIGLINGYIESKDESSGNSPEGLGIILLSDTYTFNRKVFNKVGGTLTIGFYLCDAKGLIKGRTQTARGVKYHVNLHLGEKDGKRNALGNVVLPYPTYNDELYRITGTQAYVDKEYLIPADRLEEEGSADAYMHKYGAMNYVNNKENPVYGPHASTYTKWDDWEGEIEDERWESIMHTPHAAHVPDPVFSQSGEHIWFSETALRSEKLGEPEKLLATDSFSGPTLKDWTKWGVEFPDAYTGQDGQMHWASNDNRILRSGHSVAGVTAIGGCGSPLSEEIKRTILDNIKEKDPDISEKRLEVVREAMNIVGKYEYVWGNTDCSGYVTMVYNNILKKYGLGSTYLGASHISTIGFAHNFGNKFNYRAPGSMPKAGDFMVAHSRGSSPDGSQYFDHIVLFLGKTSLGEFTILESSGAGYGNASGPSLKGFKSFEDFVAAEGASQFTPQGETPWGIVGYPKIIGD